ncbi:MAG: efflux transporter outer membrane subunit, partial [Candidatus Methylumidiphilus sp.]
LRLARARLTQARAQTRAAAALRWPSVNGSAAYQRERISPNALRGLLGSAQDGSNGAADGLVSSLGPLGTPFDLFQAGFDSRWELDLFGGIARQNEAAAANAEAAEEAGHGVQVSLTAEVGRNYLELATLRRRLEIAQQRLEIQRKVHQLAQVAYQEGLAGTLDVGRAQAEMEIAEAAVPNLQAQMQNTGHALALLLGQPPAALDARLAGMAQTLPNAPAIPPGLPSDLLRRRPDIRQAERGLAAATAAIGAAVAELFPKLALTGVAGFQSQDLGNFANLSSGFYGFGPRLSLPIFQAGRLLANIDTQEAKAAEALTLYEKTVLAALREVEDALAALVGEQRRKQSLAAAAATAKHNADAALAIYTEGETGLETVLDAARTWYDAQEQLALSEHAWASGHVSLCKALGGGWNNEAGLIAPVAP